MVAGVAADGTAWKPAIIVARVTIKCELLFWNYGSGNVIFKFQEYGFITIPLFEEWMNAVLIPYVQTKRVLTVYTGRAKLILEGCIGQRTSVFQAFL
jgi:hypothetical protein